MASMRHVQISPAQKIFAGMDIYFAARARFPGIYGNDASLFYLMAFIENRRIGVGLFYI